MVLSSRPGPLALSMPLAFLPGTFAARIQPQAGGTYYVGTPSAKERR